jgi:hypothetical protein
MKGITPNPMSHLVPLLEFNPREGFEIPESAEGLDDLLWFCQDRDGVRLLSGAGSMACFELALEDEDGEGEFLARQAEGGAKEDLGRPAPGESHDAHAFFEVTIAGQEVKGRLDEGLPRPEGSGWIGPEWMRWW